MPYFNAPIYLENKQQVGKIDEIFGNIRDYYVSIRLQEDVKAKSFKLKQKVSEVFFCHHSLYRDVAVMRICKKHAHVY